MKISDYGVIGNSRTAALISRDGSLDWCCLPQFDSPAWFGSLLGNAGRFSLRMEQSSGSEQHYLRDTNVLQTTFHSDEGALRLLDCFTVSAEREKLAELDPSDEILRVVEGVTGEVRVQLHYEPVMDYGGKRPRLRRIGGWGVVAEFGVEALFLLSSGDLGRFSVSEDGRTLSGNFTVRQGERVSFSMVYLNSAPGVLPRMGESFERLERTINYWRSWISRCKYSGKFEKEIRRSALLLKLLTFAPSGAVVAAPTTSLPEYVGAGRNWDYRFCWLRDASFTVQALVSLGFVDEALAYASWLLHSTRLTWPRLQVVYSVYGEATLPERELGSLSGYAGSRPVRIGNGAATQSQLDVYGEVLDSFARLLPYLEPVDRETRKLLTGMGRFVARHWMRPDSGIWESRGSLRHYTHSKLMCWLALDRLAIIGAERGWKETNGCSAEAERVRSWIEVNGFASGHYVQASGYGDLDASLLVMPLVGYCDAAAPRMIETRNAIRSRLSRGRLLYRYEPGSDGFPAPEGTFNLCSLWMAENLIAAGERQEGLAWIEGVLRHGNSTGLWSEELEPKTGNFLGNYPQAFTHIGLINAVRRAA